MLRLLPALLATLILLPVATTALAADTPAPAAASSPVAAPNQVHIDNFAFSPATITVKAGDTVTWVNYDDIPHTVVHDDQPRVFKSPPMDSEGSFSYTFAKPGTYKYFCSIHPHMTGVVVVK